MKNNNSTLIIGLIFCALLLGCGFALLLIGECCGLKCFGIFVFIYVMSFPFLMYLMVSCKCRKNETSDANEQIKKELSGIIKTELKEYTESNDKRCLEIKKVYESCFDYLTQYQSVSTKAKKEKTQPSFEK